MCGIAGFSLSKHSKVNARALSHNLLAQIEYRGNMAAGFAYAKPDRDFEIYKEPVAGGNLKLHGLPRNAKTVILHTRLATQGTVEHSPNNHPVLSPDGNIALTHNGVIYNDYSLRHEELKEYALAEVDSAVIPALLQIGGLAKLKELAGYAAISWLENGSANRLHIARLEDAPVAYTSLLDGSFVYASTPALLAAALELTGLEYGGIRLMYERDYFIVQDGIVMLDDVSPKLEGASSFTWGQTQTFKELTSGNHGSATAGSEYSGPIGVYGNTYSGSGAWTELTDEELEALEIEAEYDKYLAGDPDYAPDEAKVYSKAMALLDKEFPNDEYYTVDSWGNQKGYASLDALEGDLKWHAGLHDGEDHFGVEGLARWCNFFVDIGSYRLDGEQVSWVDDPTEILYHEDPAGDGLGYVNEGVMSLKAEVGR